MVGSKVRRPLPGFSEFKRPSRALASGTPNTGGNPSGFILEDNQGNAWYIYIDALGCMRMQPAATIEPNPLTAQPSYDFSAAAGAFTATPFQKTVTGMVDNTATDIFTVTVPNSAQAATFLIQSIGSLGAGGAIGAWEASATQITTLTVARTAGVAAVGTLSSAAATSNAAVSGAATITFTSQLSSISGAVGAVNTFTFQLKVAKGSGNSANHVGAVLVTMLNNVASGVTIA